MESRQFDGLEQTTPAVRRLRWWCGRVFTRTCFRCNELCTFMVLCGEFVSAGILRVEFGCAFLHAPHARNLKTHRPMDASRWRLNVRALVV